MEIKRYLKLLKVSLLLTPFWSHSQNWQKISEISLAQSPTAYTADFQGNLYLGFADGKLTRYDAKGSILENFSLSNNSSISLIDVQNNLKPFLFYFDNQQITILDRFSSVPKNYLLSDLGLEIGLMTCPAPDGDFWILENNPQRLKKVDPLLKVTVLEVQISIGDKIKRMQAYQNVLVIGDESGIRIFDQFGGTVNHLQKEDLLDFQILKGRLYAFTPDYITEIDLFDGTVLEEINNPTSATNLMKTINGFITIQDRTLTFYSVTN